MRTALTATALTTGALALAATALTGPAVAAPPQDRGPVRSTLDTAFGTVVVGDVFVTLDGFARPEASTGVAELFVAGAECFRPEGGGFTFTADPLRTAAMRGTAVLECYDVEADRASTATLTVELDWTAAGEPTTSRAVSHRLGCRTTRTTVPAELTGTVRVEAAELGVDVLLPATADRPAELATSEDVCRPSRG